MWEGMWENSWQVTSRWSERSSLMGSMKGAHENISTWSLREQAQIAGAVEKLSQRVPLWNRFISSRHYSSFSKSSVLPIHAAIITPGWSFWHHRLSLTMNIVHDSFIYGIAVD